jgi:hypothetical protein
MAYDLGQKVRVSAPFTLLSDSSAVDPDVVKLSVRTPAGVTTTYTYGVGDTIVKDSTGNYHADISTTEAGVWVYRWFSTGNGQTAGEEEFSVKSARAV